MRLVTAALYTQKFSVKLMCFLDVRTFSIFAKSVSFSTVSVDISGPADTNTETRGESLLCTT